MSYMSAQALLKTTIEGASTFFSEGDVVEGDVRILDSGRDNIAIIYPGSIPSHDLMGMRRAIVWEALVDVVKRFSDYSSYNAFGTLRDALVAQLEDRRCMSAAYWIVSIATVEDPVEIGEKGSSAGPFFIMQRLRITIQENI
jgi:hypothetical protein